MSIVTQIETANALGRQNLNTKGVETDGTETTYQIMSKIANVTGGGVEYSSIVYNDDGTITLTETNGTIRTMTCEYEDGKLVSLKYGDKVIDLTYDNDVLVGIGGMEVDVSKAPATNGLKDFIEGTMTELIDATITQLAHRGALAIYPLTKIDLSSLISVKDNAKSYIGFPQQIVSINLPNFTGGMYCYDLKNLTTINCPKIKSISPNGFRGCDALIGDLKFENMGTIGANAFRESKIESIDLDGESISFDENVFASCSKLTKVILRSNNVVTLLTSYAISSSPIASGKCYVYVPDDLVESYKVAQYWSNYPNQIKPLSELGGETL